MKLAWSSGVVVAFVFSLASRVSAQSHTFAPPPKPSGSEYVYADATVSFAYGTPSPVRSWCSWWHPITYTFFWGDGTSSKEYTGAGPVSYEFRNAAGLKTWSRPGRFEVRLQAGCSGGLSTVSPALSVTVVDSSKMHRLVATGKLTIKEETPWGGYFSGVLVRCSFGHPVQYLFSWGNGEQSPYHWNRRRYLRFKAPGVYTVSVQAKCRGGLLTGVLTDRAVVKKVPRHEVPAPKVEAVSADGPSAASWRFSAKVEGPCSWNHAVNDYRFYWGDGRYSAWTGALPLSMPGWGNAGTYKVRAQAKCTEGVGSNWSADAETVIYQPEDEQQVRPQPTTPATDEPEGDGGELAVFSTKDTKPVKFGKLPWTPGMTWKVDTYYKNLQHPERAEWSPKPIEWRFTVRGAEKIDGRDAWALDVQPTDTSDMPYNPGGTVYVSMEDHAILAVRDRIQENGEIRDRYMRFDDAGATATSSFLPVDLPGLGTDGLERSASTTAMAPDPFRPDPPNVVPPTTSGKVIDVEFEADGDTIRQRWDTAHPYWPAYSGTASRVSYLKNGP